MIAGFISRGGGGGGGAELGSFHRIPHACIYWFVVAPPH